MSRDRVVVERLSDVSPNRYADGYVLIWYLAEEGDLGGELDGTTKEHALSALAGDGWESVAMDVEARAVAEVSGATYHDGHLVWPSKRSAEKALQAIKVRVAARRAKRPLPEWATQAIAAGWKPPNGWAP